MFIEFVRRGKIMAYLTKNQLDHLAESIAKELSLTDTIDGERFESLLEDTFDDATVINEKQWFDVRRGSEGLEVKTFKTERTNVEPGAVMTNILKRVPSYILSDELVADNNSEEQVDMSADPEQVGRELLDHLEEKMETHAEQADIDGTYKFSVLFRNIDQTQIGYWEEEIVFEDASEYDWEWRDSGLKARKDGNTVLSWYTTNQMQLAYRFEAPDDVQVRNVDEVDVNLLTNSELEELLTQAYNAGKQEV